MVLQKYQYIYTNMLKSADQISFAYGQTIRIDNNQCFGVQTRQLWHLSVLKKLFRVLRLIDVFLIDFN